jgi:hypothetical protein
VPPPKDLEVTIKAHEHPEAYIMVGGSIPQEEPNPKSIGYLRWAAKQYYATNPNHCTVEKMHKHEVFREVPLRALHEWCARDGWVEERRRVNEKVRQVLEKEVISEIARTRIVQLKKMQELFDESMSMFNATDLDLKPKSYEGLLNSVTRLAAVLDEWREKLAMQIVPAMSAVEEDPEDSPDRLEIPVTPKLSQDEARTVVKAIIQTRRQAITQKSSSKASDIIDVTPEDNGR